MDDRDSLLIIELQFLRADMDDMEVGLRKLMVAEAYQGDKNCPRG